MKSPKNDTKSAIKLFLGQQKSYKTLIDKDIEQYCKQIKRTTLQNYGANSRLSIDAFCGILQRGGKRIRGSLTILGYEMSGGKDKDMIIQAARIVEMMHAYILIVDDFQDRSDTRRGGPSAHRILADYHKVHHLGGNSEHFGASVAMNAALAGNHAAMMQLSNLNANEHLRIKALSILNRTMIITSHGQTCDIMNEVVDSVSEPEIDQVLEWKTANYTILNPLHMGMVLAGADCHDTDAITEYAMHTGRAFQITDDILGVFGEEFESGKSPVDDIREGKKTLLTVHALKHSTNGNKNFLIQMLGKKNITQAEFRRCRDIIVESGALEYAQKVATNHVQKALNSLEKHSDKWTLDGIDFLSGLAAYLLMRRS